MFQGTMWPYNGPWLVTRCAKTLCPQFSFLTKCTLNEQNYKQTNPKDVNLRCKTPANVTTEICNGMTVTPVTDFLPISYYKIYALFNSKSIDYGFKVINIKQIFNVEILYIILYTYCMIIYN